MIAIILYARVYIIELPLYPLYSKKFCCLKLSTTQASHCLVCAVKKPGNATCDAHFVAEYGVSSYSYSYLNFRCDNIKT